LVFGVFGGIGFDDGGVGTVGGEFGIDGDEGGGGVCCIQPAALALSAMAANIDNIVDNIDRVAFIWHSSLEKVMRITSWRYKLALTPALAAIA
jgi:hypothetical protein